MSKRSVVSLVGTVSAAFLFFLGMWAWAYFDGEAVADAAAEAAGSAVIFGVLFGVWMYFTMWRFIGREDR